MHTSYFGELEKELRKQILSGELPEGKPIPTEMELMSRYKLGRTTVRKALQKLVDSGMLHKVHGIGTFVIPKEDWHQETVHLKVLLIVPGFLGRIENEDLFDRSLIAGVADYSYLHHSSLEIHRQEPSAKKLLAGTATSRSAELSGNVPGRNIFQPSQSCINWACLRLQSTVNWMASRPFFLIMNGFLKVWSTYSLRQGEGRSYSVTCS